MWNIIVALPISTPHMQVIVYGIELTGETPRFDFTETAIPIVILKRKICNEFKKYENQTADVFYRTFYNALSYFHTLLQADFETYPFPLLKSRLLQYFQLYQIFR